MGKQLVIVESPAKARTIEKFLGGDFNVKSSYGHIRDLPTKGMSIAIDKNFEPTYEVPVDKRKTVNELKKAVKEADSVWLATDEDREGEAIAWHLCKALGLSEKLAKRIVFHEITKSAIEAAIAKPRSLDLHLVDAQQARRVLDRLVGYELSPILWKKVRKGLSAGRVQSVAVRLIVEREREIDNFKPTVGFKITAELSADKDVLRAEQPQQLADNTAAKQFLNDCAEADFKVASLTTKPTKRSPSPPFTTSTLQQAAARSLGFSVRQTMVLAQRLYEAGQITYMRTDSLNLAEGAITQAAKVIKQLYGDNYAESRRYKAKTSGAQEAHEAIRPTDFSQDSVAGEPAQQKLYSLIWRRAMASQMAAAQLEKTDVKIAISTRQEQLAASGEVVKFDGWLKLFSTKDPEAKLLPPLKEGQVLQLVEMAATESLSKPKPRYSEASLVKKLEALGIGRPSTYAPTISTIQTRDYVQKADVEGKPQAIMVLTLKDGQVSETKTEIQYGADKNKLLPTDIGEVVTDFLVKQFPEIVDYDFTAKVEANFDNIATGQETWNSMIKDFYGPFHNTVGKAENVSRAEAQKAKELGKDPASGKPIIARLGRYGPMLQIGEAEDDEKPKFAPIPDGKKIDTITLEEALEMFKLPRLVGKTAKGEDMLANYGRFGPYVKVDKTFVSIKPDDPFTITEERAKKLYAEKLDKDAKKNIKEFDGGKLKILNGPYGAYITDGTKNARVPKDQDPTKFSQEEAQKLLDEAPVRRRRPTVRK